MKYSKRTLVTLLSIILIISIQSVTAAHFIAGQILDAYDGTAADGRTAILFNPNNGITDNQTDIIGPTGNSGVSNYILIDCELLSTPCQVGDTLSVQLLNTGDNYTAGQVNVTVTGAGFDTFTDIRLNSPPIIQQITITNQSNSHLSEIDLNANSTKTIQCHSIVLDYENETDLMNISAYFFINTSNPYASDDNNIHYTNTSCFLNKTYGNTNQTLVTCSFELQYYTNPAIWNCTFFAYDSQSISKPKSNTSLINTLLAITIPDTLYFGKINVTLLSNEQSLQIINSGNVRSNLSLYTYGATLNDGLAMNCSSGVIRTVKAENLKYNLSDSNPGDLTLDQSASYYENMSNLSSVRKFALPSRQNDAQNEAFNTTYWRIYLPQQLAGNCSGNLVIGATQNPET